MAWTHRGFEIDLRGASFFATVGGKYVSLSSLNAVKKAIDKHLDKKAEEVKLSLPVVMRIQEGRYYRNPDSKKPDRVIHGIITGMDAESLEATGLEIPKDWSIQDCLPDTPENVKRLERCIAADAAKHLAEKDTAGRTVGRSFGSYSRRDKRTYSEAVEMLKDSYEKAKKGESND